MWLIECPRCNYESDLAGFDAKVVDQEECCECPECGRQFTINCDIDSYCEWENEDD